MRTRPGDGGSHRYLYFDAADPYYYDHSGSVTISFSYFDDGADFRLHVEGSELALTCIEMTKLPEGYAK